VRFLNSSIPYVTGSPITLERPLGDVWIIFSEPPGVRRPQRPRR
jgi:hypothetical protein